MESWIISTPDEEDEEETDVEDTTEEPQNGVRPEIRSHGTQSHHRCQQQRCHREALLPPQTMQ